MNYAKLLFLFNLWSLKYKIRASSLFSHCTRNCCSSESERCERSWICARIIYLLFNFWMFSFSLSLVVSRHSEREEWKGGSRGRRRQELKWRREWAINNAKITWKKMEKRAFFSKQWIFLLFHFWITLSRSYTFCVFAGFGCSFIVSKCCYIFLECVLARVARLRRRLMDLIPARLLPVAFRVVGIALRISYAHFFLHSFSSRTTISHLKWKSFKIVL